MRNELKDWAKGYVTITIHGKRFERLLNMAVRQGLHIWNVSRIGEELSRCNISVDDYLRLRPLLRETGCRTRVVRREGLPFWLVHFRKRAGFMLGSFLFLLGLYMLSSFVWNVEVIGTHKISEQEVTQAAEKIGIKPGAWKVTLSDPLSLQRKLQEMMPNASWVGVEVRGTSVIIQVVEKAEQEKPKESGPRHLVAAKKAVITNVYAEAGKSLVRVNQFVEKGQVLISGIIGNEQRQKAVAAKGKVEGEVWYITDVNVPTSYVRHSFTGQKQDHYYLLAGSYAVRLWPFEAEMFERYEKTEKRFYPSVSSYRLPLGLKRETLLETREQKQTVNREEAVEIAKRIARQDVLKRAGKDATVKGEKVLHVKEENGKVYLRIHYTVIEDIAQEQPIVPLPPAPAEKPDKPDE